MALYVPSLVHSYPARITTRGYCVHLDLPYLVNQMKWQRSSQSTGAAFLSAYGCRTPLCCEPVKAEAQIHV
jgi:hypothetical protein